MLRGRTVLFLPHRISTIRNCDTVFLLYNGKIEAQGDHRELVLLAFLIGDRAFCGGGCGYQPGVELRGRKAVASQNSRRGGAGHQNTGQRDNGDGSSQKWSPFPPTAHS